MEISFRKFYGPGLMFIGLLILTIFSFQYPFMAKIPLGNDDPTHIQTARYPFIAPAFSSVSKKLSVFKSTYPLSEVLFTLARFLPFSWSQRFMIWMALGHLLSGIALGYLLKKIAGTGPAVVGMIFWAISAIGVLSFIEVGFMPQLWSMIFLLIFMERLLSKSITGSIVALIAVWFAHPGTFFVCALALAITLPQLIIARFTCKNPKKCILFRPTATVAIGTTLITLFVIFNRWPEYITAEKIFGTYRTISYYLSSQIGIIIPLVPIGFFVFIHNQKISSYFRLFFAVFGTMSIVLGLNSILGIGVLESRFEPFMIISIIVFGSLGLVEILKHVFSSSFLRYLVLTAILLIACFQGWNATAYYLAHRENNKAYQHLSPSQEEVFQWMKENLPTNAVVAQSDPLPDGIVRWLPVISDRGSFNTKIFTEKSCAELMEEMVKLPTTHVIFFTKYQVVPDFYQNNPQLFKLLYDKNDSLIFQLPIEQIKNSNDKNTLCTNQ